MDLLRELAESRPERIRAVLRHFGALVGEDRSSARLRQATGDEIDLAVPAHRTALLAWLRAWGCRHLRVADGGRSSKALAFWWRRHAASLPAASRPLAELSGPELDLAARAFGALAAAPAAFRSTSSGSVGVTFGQTAAAKALFAIRPLALPPWDEPIRNRLGVLGTDGYREYLEQVGGALRALSNRLQVPVDDLPRVLGRPGSSPPRIVDEYLWMRVNRGR